MHLQEGGRQLKGTVAPVFLVSETGLTVRKGATASVSWTPVLALNTWIVCDLFTRTDTRRDGHS